MRKVVWVMTQAQSDLLQETLQMDSQSNAFDSSLQTEIRKALNRVKWYTEHEYQKKVFANLKIRKEPV